MELNKSYKILIIFTTLTAAAAAASPVAATVVVVVASAVAVLFFFLSFVHLFIHSCISYAHGISLSFHITATFIYDEILKLVFFSLT